MAKPDNNIYEQVYNIKEDASVTSGVTVVVCVLVQRGLFVAGFSESNELLTIHYSGYNHNRPVWEVSFFENTFIQDPLLADKNKVKGVFIGGSRNLIIPDPLYDENEANNWLSHIHFIERTDVTSTWTLPGDNAKYVMAMPVHISELVKINFKKATTQPFAIHQFTEKHDGLYLRCTVSPEEVYATLHKHGQLQWHKVFDYARGEDIAFAIRQLCEESNIAHNDITVRCNTLAATEYTTINELSQFFPALKAGTDQSYRYGWDGAISLAHQLLSCV